MTLESRNQATSDVTVFQWQSSDRITLRIQWKKEKTLYWGID